MKAIRRSGYPITLCRRSYTLRNAVAKRTQPVCHGARQCLAAAKGQCAMMGVVYSMDGTCGARYVGSTGRLLHRRTMEHVTGKPTPTAVSTHLGECDADHAIRVVARGVDLVDTRLKEALIIEEEAPVLNGRTELNQWLRRLH